MSIEVIVVTCLVITGVVFLFSMVGQGGGSSYVPVLLAAGMSMREASTTGLFMIMLASISATLVFGHKRTIDWKLLFAIAIPSLLSSFLGGYVAQWVSVPILKIIFTVMLITAAIFMFGRQGKRGKARPNPVTQDGLAAVTGDIGHHSDSLISLDDCKDVQNRSIR